MAERKNTFGRIHDLPNFWRQFHQFHQLPTPACTYIHMYTHTCTCMCVHVYVCMYVCECTCAYVHAGVGTVHVCVHVSFCLSVYMCVCVLVYIMFVCAYVHVCVGVCSCRMNLTFMVNYTCRYFRDATLNICKCPSKDLSIEDTGWQSNSSFFQEELAYYKMSAVLCYVCVIDNVCV